MSLPVVLVILDRGGKQSITECRFPFKSVYNVPSSIPYLNQIHLGTN
jgi:hypothetical protein